MFRYDDAPSAGGELHVKTPGLLVDYDHGAMITVGHPWVEQDGLVFTPGRLVPSTTVPARDPFRMGPV